MPSDHPQTCPSCGTRLNAEGICPSCDTEQTRTDLISFPSIEGYRVLRNLGEGAMGTVFLAEDRHLKRLVAIKMISSRFVEDSQFVSRFLREAQSMAALEDPHIVRIYSFGTIEGKPYLVMEFVQGETLAEKIQKEGALKVDDALQIATETAEALRAAWQKNIIHRDIKPSNILVGKNQSVKIADFGLAKVLAAEESSSLTLSGVIMGTPHYIAPEQALHGEGDFRSDIYSLGLVLFEMVTGRKPFNGPTAMAIVHKQINEPLSSAREFRKDLNRQIDLLINSMAKKSAEERPQSYEELLSEIQRVKQYRRPVLLKEKWKLAAATLLIALAIIVGISRIQQKPTPELSKPQTFTNSKTPVFLNALPWAKVRVIDSKTDAQVAEAITPAILSLEEGKYLVEIQGPSHDIIRQTLSVTQNGSNRLVIMLPGYDPYKGLELIQSQ